jgi:hypothetical protein
MFGDIDKAHAAKAAKKAEWAKLPLRQDWLDEPWMRGFLRRAGITAPARSEPATVKRLRQILRRVKLHDEFSTAAVGCSLERFLELNTNLPLWAAIALVIESSGYFDPSPSEAQRISDEETDSTNLSTNT